MGGGERPSAKEAPTWLGEVGSPGTRPGQGARSPPWGRLLTGAGPPTHPDFPTTIYHLKWAFVTRGKWGSSSRGGGGGKVSHAPMPLHPMVVVTVLVRHAANFRPQVLGEKCTTLSP